MNFGNKRIAVIFNPKGGSASGGVIDALKAELEARGLTLAQYTTSPAPGSARELAKQARSDGADLVIACGGDGTVCQVAEGLMWTDTPMAVLPGGTGNLFARTFNSRTDVRRFVEQISLGQPQKLDMMQLKYVDLDGRKHDQVYLVALGLGNISDAISFASAKWKRRFGSLVYVWRVLKASLNPRSVIYTLTSDDGVWTGNVKASAVFALNAVPPSMGTLSRGCNASDGLVDLVLLRATDFAGLLGFSLRMATGRPDLSSDYRRMRCNVVRIQTDLPVCPNIDGDPGVLTRDMEIRALPQAVKVIVS